MDYAKESLMSINILLTAILIRCVDMNSKGLTIGYNGYHF